MPSSWFGKKDADEVERAEAPGPADEAARETLDGKIAALADKPDEVQAAVNRQNSVLCDLVDQVHGVAEELPGDCSDSPAGKLGRSPSQTEEPESQASSTQPSDAWHSAILGPDLAAHPNLAFKRQQLLDGVLEGDPGARSLAGQLLVFQSAPADRLPKLLKEIGEAYYRWQPKTGPGTNPFEETLVRWLEKTCDGAGISNTIELVHRGERFDAARHNAASRGVEITEVLGWIVLRTGGKVYTKASVAVQ